MISDKWKKNTNASFNKDTTFWRKLAKRNLSPLIQVYQLVYLFNITNIFAVVGLVANNLN
jgi:hypothetical protein